MRSWLLILGVTTTLRATTQEISKSDMGQDLIILNAAILIFANIIISA